MELLKSKSMVYWNSSGEPDRISQDIERAGVIMAGMTDEEYDALDERWTKTPPKVNFTRPGIFARQRALLDILDKATASYIMTKAEATNQTPAQVISKIVHREIAAGI